MNFQWNRPSNHSKPSIWSWTPWTPPSRARGRWVPGNWWCSWRWTPHRASPMIFRYGGSPGTQRYWMLTYQGVIQSLDRFNLTDFGLVICFREPKELQFCQRDFRLSFWRHNRLPKGSLLSCKCCGQRVNGRDLVVLRVVHTAHQRLQVASAGDVRRQKPMGGVHGGHLKMDNLKGV